jgi:hypothetical protein
MSAASIAASRRATRPSAIKSPRRRRDINEVYCRTRLKSTRSDVGLVSRVTPVHTAMRNCTRDEGGPFEVDNQVLISSHRKLLSSKAMVVNVAEKSKRDFDRYD